MTDTGAFGSSNTYQNYILLKTTTSKVVSAMSHTGSTTTVTCTGHGLSINDWVTIWGADQYWYNLGGQFVASVPDANTFTFTDYQSGTTSATSSGTMYMCEGNRHAIIDQHDANTITFHPSAHAAGALTFAAGEGYRINKVIQSMDQCGVFGGDDFDGVWAPSIPGAWNNQTVSPWYEWDNTVNGGDADLTAGHSGGSGAMYALVTEGVHFFNDTEFVYTPYTSPHPLVGGEEEPDPSATTYRAKTRGKRAKLLAK